MTRLTVASMASLRPGSIVLYNHEDGRKLTGVIGSKQTNGVQFATFHQGLCQSQLIGLDEPVEILMEPETVSKSLLREASDWTHTRNNSPASAIEMNVFLAGILGSLKSITRQDSALAHVIDRIYTKLHQVGAETK